MQKQKQKQADAFRGGPLASREKLVLLRLLVANELLRPTRSLRGLVWTRLFRWSLCLLLQSF